MARSRPQPLSYSEKSTLFASRALLYPSASIAVVGIAVGIAELRGGAPPTLWYPIALLAALLLYRMATCIISFWSPRAFLAYLRLILVLDALAQSTVTSVAFAFPFRATPIETRSVTFEHLMSVTLFVLLGLTMGDVLVILSIQVPTALYCELAKQPAGTPLVDYLLRAAIVTALLVGLPLVMHMLVSYRRRAAEAAEPATEPPAHGEHSAAAGGQQQEVERQTAGSRAALRPIDAAPSSSPLLLLATLGCVAFLAFEICKQIRAASGEGEGLKRIDGVVCPAAATEVIVTNNMCLLLGHLVQLHVHRTLDSVTDDHRAQLHSRFHRCVATAIERRGMRHVSLWNVKTLVIVFPYFMYMYIHLKQLAALFPSAACAALGLRRERCLCPSSPAEIWAGCVATFALGAMEKQWLVDALREQLAFYRFWLQEPGVEEALRRISEPGHRMSRDASPQPRRAAAAGDGDGGGEPSSVPLLVEQRLLSGLRQLKGERAQQHKRRQQ